jgi:hypothetical protein
LSGSNAARIARTHILEREHSLDRIDIVALPAASEGHFDRRWHDPAVERPQLLVHQRPPRHPA